MIPPYTTAPAQQRAARTAATQASVVAEATK